MKVLLCGTFGIFLCYINKADTRINNFSSRVVAMLEQSDATKCRMIIRAVASVRKRGGRHRRESSLYWLRSRNF